MLLGAVFGDVIAGVGVAHDARRGIVPQHPGDAAVGVLGDKVPQVRMSLAADESAPFGPLRSLLNQSSASALLRKFYSKTCPGLIPLGYGKTLQADQGSCF